MGYYDFRQYSELYHHGILGMHWGIRRFQNKDGSLTPEGKRRKNLSYKDAYDEFEKQKDKINNKYDNTVGVATVAGYSGGTLAGLGAAAGAAPLGPAAAVAAYFGVKYGAVLASMILGHMVAGGDPDKKIDVIRKSYGEKRIKKMEELAKKKVTEMSNKANNVWDDDPRYSASGNLHSHMHTHHNL